MSVRIVTDSGCDLSDAELNEWGIGMVPLSIRFGDDEFIDRTELTTDEFYRRLAASDALPETSAPAPGAFAAMFNKMAGEGATAVVCINLSEALSATIQSARTAATSDDVSIDVRVVNSKSITGGLGSIVLACAKAGRDGASADDVVALAEGMSSRTRIYATLDTLDNLKKGGRIGGAQAAFGAMLSIKPLLDLSSGEVVAAGKQRTRRRSLAWVRDQLEQTVRHSERRYRTHQHHRCGNRHPWWPRHHRNHLPSPCLSSPAMRWPDVPSSVCAQWRRTHPPIALP